MAVLLISMLVVIVISFVVLILFMKKIINRDVVSATSHLDNLTSEFTQKEEDIKRQYEEARLKSQQMLENAKHDAGEQKENIIRQAEEEKNKLIIEAEAKATEIIKQADNARLALLAEVNEKINEKSVAKAAQLLEKALPENIRLEIHHLWVEDLINSSFESFDRLKVSRKDIKEIRIVSAFKLNQKQHTTLAVKLKEKLGHEVKLIEEKNPALIAGVVVNIGSLCLDGSLRFKIQEVARGE